MRELVRHDVFGTAAADDFRIIGKAVQVLVVVGDGQHIAFLAQVAPVESEVGIGKKIGHVGHPGSVGQVGRGSPDHGLLAVAHVHVAEVSAEAEPFAEAVAGREVVADGLHLAVVDIGGRFLAPAEVGDVALDVVPGVAVDEAAFQIEAVLAEFPVVAQVEVQVVAVFGPQAHLPHFQVLVAEHFLDGRQAAGFFIGKLGLEAFHDEISPGRAVAEGTDIARMLYVVALGLVFGNRPGDVLMVEFPENGKVPFPAGHQPVGKAGDILAGHFGNGVDDRVLGQERGVLAVEGVEYMVQAEHVHLAQAVVQA